MAMYKVPQDVEADDKLIGPFSFRQFIYLIIVAIAIAIGWGLSQLFIPLAIIPLPIVLFFGALALPLRKDQPMEIYLAAIVSFYLKPRKRLWVPDGIQSLVEITAPKTVEVHRTKDLSQTEAQQRLSYLADIVDTGGWAIRGVAMPEAPGPMKSDVFYEAQQTEDVLDDDGGVSRNIDAMINQADAKRRQEAIESMRRPAAEPAPAPPPEPTGEPSYQIPDPYTVLSSAPAPNMTAPSDPRFNFNPYPNSMRQRVIAPMDDQPAAPAPDQPQPESSPAPAQTEQPAPAAAPAQTESVQPQQPTEPVEQPVQPPAAPQPEAVPAPAPQPVEPPPPQPAADEPSSTSEKGPSPDILNLVNSSGLSIETIAHEANRISQREQSNDDEVVISLR